MRTVAFHVAKGGVGKTTLAGNTAYLASRHQTVALIDADPQGSITSWLVPSGYQHELADVAAGDVSVADALVEVSPGLLILPTRGLAGGLKKFSETTLFQRPIVFDRLRRELTDLGIDLVVYDLSPGMSQLERCVLMSCDEVVLPSLAEFFSVDGVDTATHLIDEINADWDRNVRADRLVVNAVNRSYRRHVQAHAEYQRLERFELFTVLQDAKVAESQYAHLPLPLYDAKARAIPEMVRLAEAIV